MLHGPWGVVLLAWLLAAPAKVWAGPVSRSYHPPFLGTDGIKSVGRSLPGVVGPLTLPAGVSDSDFIGFSPWIVGEVVPFPPFTDVHLLQAIVVNHRTPMLSLTIPMDYFKSFGWWPYLSTLILDSSVVTAPDIRGISFGPAGHDSLWSSREVIVDNVNRKVLLRFVASTPVSPRDDTLCYLHWLIVWPYESFGAAVIDTTEIDGHHLALGTMDDTLTPSWSWGGVFVGEVPVSEAPNSMNSPARLEIAPNPFNASARVRYTLASASQVQLQVYNSLGLRIQQVPIGMRPAGTHVANWNGRDEQNHSASSGVYFFVLETRNGRMIASGVLLK